MANNPELNEFVNHAIKTHGEGTAQGLASKIGMSLSAFSRAVREEGTLSEGNCLKLAHLCGEQPSTILRLARRPEDVIVAADEMYGNDEAFSRREKRLVRLWRNAETGAQDAILALLQMAAKTADSALSSGQPEAADKTKRAKRATGSKQGLAAQGHGLVAVRRAKKQSSHAGSEKHASPR